MAHLNQSIEDPPSQYHSTPLRRNPADTSSGDHQSQSTTIVQQELQSDEASTASSRFRDINFHTNTSENVTLSLVTCTKCERVGQSKTCQMLYHYYLGATVT